MQTSAAVERYHLFALLLQGLRIAVPAALLLAIPAEAVQSVLEAMPAWLSGGMAVGGGMVVAVGYAMVINMMATREVWPFFALGFAFCYQPIDTYRTWCYRCCNRAYLPQLVKTRRFR